ncbi:GNAT family N-acetyltransferase [Paenibacillus aestuarii]|uniref:VC0807 family protein n=1 Tax=Paenibacillus aestuarii TaxID=516965 RepID=A0ABW0K879_9BACL|nr:GNAT family N-acetyltransferase [Paenibacillus aestuarii]
MSAKRYIVFSLLINGIIPWLLYVVLAHFMTSILALTIATLVPLADNLVHLWKHRKLDALGSLMLFTFVLTLILAMLGGSEKLLLIRESLITGSVGLIFLGSLLFRRPLMFYLAQRFVPGTAFEDNLNYPYFLTVLRLMSLGWGLILLSESVVRVYLVFQLSTAQFLAVSNVVLYGFIGAAILWTVWYRRRSAKRLAAIKLRAAEESIGDIVVLRPEHLPEALDLYRTVTDRLRQQGIHQWDRYYPNRFVIKQDIAHGCLYGLRGQGRIIAAVAVNRQQSDKYAGIHWSDVQGNPAIIHRLAVHPSAQGKGIGKQLLEFAESHARNKGYTSVRLDVYSANPSAVSMYERYGYTHKGEIQFPFRKAPYFCMEKVW